MNYSMNFSGGRYGLASPEFYCSDSSEDSDEAYQLGDDGYGTSESDELCPHKKLDQVGRSKFKRKIKRKVKRNKRQKERKALETFYFAQLKKILMRLHLVFPRQGARGVTQYEILSITRETIQSHTNRGNSPELQENKRFAASLEPPEPCQVLQGQGKNWTPYSPHYEHQ